MLGPFVSMSLSPTDGKDNLTKWILSFPDPITVVSAHIPVTKKAAKPSIVTT